MRLSFFVYVVSAVLTFAWSDARAQDPGRIMVEFERLHDLASRLEPEFTVGGYLKGKRYGDHELLWHLAEEKGDAEMIRIYRVKGEGEQPFDVTFHRNDSIVPGRNVVRRFFGPANTGWRNDTVDTETGEYLGSQGARQPRLDARDFEIMREWQIEPIDD